LEGGGPEKKEGGNPVCNIFSPKKKGSFSREAAKKKNLWRKEEQRSGSFTLQEEGLTFKWKKKIDHQSL